MASEKKTKNDRLVIRLESEMRASLREKASQLGLDEAAYVRMLIYADVNGLTAAPSAREPEYLGEVGRLRHPQASPPMSIFPASGEAENLDMEPRAEEMDIPADPDGEPSLDALMGAGPSLLDEIAALTATPRPEPPAYAQHRQMPSYRGQRYQGRGFANRNWGQAAWSGPGSLTRAVGVGDGSMGNFMGDGRGNVTRDNFGHFGFVGTRSR